MSKQDWSCYADIINREVVPALGCTEPIAIALAAAKAVETLGCQPERTIVKISGNLLKNGMGVGVPGTGMTGLDIAAAVGITGGKSELVLEVLRDLTEEQVSVAKKMLTDNVLSVELAETEETLYAEVLVRSGDDSARCVLARSHSAIVLVEKNGVEVFSAPWISVEDDDSDCKLTMKDIFEYATKAPVESLKFILEAARLNEAVASEGLAKDWGLKVGRSMVRDIEDGVRSDDVISYAVRLTAAASDARMEGISMPVMSNSGSGNQGLTATLPVVAFAKHYKSTEEQLIRSLIMSHLTAIHLKHSLGRLSALCGASLAATAAGCGIILILGGGLSEVEGTIRNTLGDIAGMVCDGAKTSCALKVASAVEAAISAAFLSMKGICIPGKDGIMDDNIETCIKNIGYLGSFGMIGADKAILKIMTSKKAAA